MTLTESAGRHIEKMLEKMPLAIGVRVDLKQAGCTGYKYVVESVESKKDTDLVIESRGIHIFIDRKKEIFLKDLEIDYVQSGLNTKLIFRNPKVEDACGCGESVRFKEDESEK